jgi:hypothetical protein
LLYIWYLFVALLLYGGLPKKQQLGAYSLCQVDRGKYSLSWA